uniref:TAT polyketide synthase n=1 Tax=Sorangium cellulosum TaxID=56 RepID=A0A0M4L8N3_SORCE|nr:tAT polyketide synthase [Sorangium cellulosum]
MMDSPGIAIIGIAGRFPDADDCDQLFENLLQGRSSIEEVPSERWSLDEHYSPDIAAPNKSTCKWVGLLDGVDRFDNAFFQISPREAMSMDPQQRLLLEEAWRCVEDSGVPLATLRSRRTAVYASTMNQDYQLRLASPGGVIDSYAAQGNYGCILANRISYTFGLRGASMLIDAACASSVVAIHQAKRALEQGDADYALVGAVNLHLHPFKYVSFSKSRFFSPSGRCRTFDKDANGYVPGEGVGVLLLQRLPDAIRARNHVHAVIKGTAVNHVGSSPSLTAPSVEAQREVLLEACREAGFAGDTVTYVEAHGTGTSLGDPIELEALNRAFKGATAERRYCRIGSVKTNIGHLDAAAGIAGVIKVVKMMSRRQIPPSLNLSEPNPIIDFDDSPFVVATEVEPWRSKAPGLPLRAGVSSFGFGGVSSHVLLESYAAPPAPDPEDGRAGWPFALSARSPVALERLVASWRRLIGSGAFARMRLGDVCATLMTGREAFPIRAGGWVTSAADVEALIEGWTRAPAARPPARWALRLAGPPCGAGPGLRAAVRRHGGLRRQVERAAAALAAVDAGGGDGAERLLDAAWPEGDRAARWLAAGHAYASYLLELGFSPEVVSSGREGLWLGLTVSGMARLEDAVAVLRGRKPASELALTRPRIPFFDPAAGQALMPVRFDAAYLRYLVAELPGPSEEASTHVRKARTLRRSQPTYRGFLDDWSRVLGERGQPLERLLQDDHLLTDASERAARERALLLVIVTSAYGRLSRKWGITRSTAGLGPGMAELVELVIDGVVPPESAVALLAEEAPNLPAIAAELARRQHLLSPDGAYPELARRRASVPEIEDVARWLRDTSAAGVDQAAAANGRPQLVLGASAGATPGQDMADVTVVDLDQPIERVALRLWLGGADIAWGELLPEGTFDRVTLPVCPFEGSSFWIPAEPSRAPSAEPSSAKAPVAVSCSSVWEEHPPVAVSPDRHRVERLLLLADGEEARAAALRHSAAAGARVVLVKPGEGYREIDRFTVEIDPGDPDHYARLVQELAGRGDLPGDIVHWWSEPAFPTRSEAIRGQLERGFFALFHLGRAVLARARGAQEKTRLFHVAAGGAEGLPQHAAVGAFARALEAETDRLVCTTLGLHGTDGGTPAATVAQWDSVLRELCSPVRTGAEIRWEGGRRYVRRLRELALEDAPPVAAPIAPRPGGVYLITGGAGELGHAVATHMGRRCSVSFVLVGRAELDAGKRARLDALRALGADVLYVRADVARREDVDGVIASAKARFGGIDGVIHAAGVFRPAYFARKEAADVEAIVAPKVHGTIHLDEALASERLDFFVLFSSITAIAAFEGVTDYAYANAFLDHFAARREALRAAGLRAGRTLSIDWPLWRDGGMHLSDEDLKAYREQTGLELLSLTEGMRLWDAVTSRVDTAHCLAARGDRDKASAFLGLGRAVEAAGARPPARPPAPEVLDADELHRRTEQLLRSMLAAELELQPEDVDPRTSFSVYGVDSVLVHHFNDRVAKVLGPTSKTVLFETRNVAELTAYVVKTHAAALAAKFLAEDAEARDRPATTAASATAAGGQPSSPAQRAGELAEAGGAADEDIAIIGVAGRYPEADDLEELWENLRSGRDCIAEVPGDRWDHTKYYDPDPDQASQGKIYGKWGGFLRDVDRFDPLFFGISPREAEVLDPQERVFLEVAWSTLEDAGYTGEQLRDVVARRRGGDVGVFVGVTTNTYLLLGPGERRAGNHAIPTSMPWSIANRVSYVLDLRGPSMPVDTACASSLTALHLACESLRRRECAMAIAGGVNLTLHPSKYLWMCQQRMLSPSGRCRTFGDKADGFVPGEGAGAVLLKRLSDALADGDPICAVVKGTASNHGGKTNGYTVPSPNAQAKLILEALDRAGVDPATIGYVEAHGTGTALGDPIEVAGLTKAFRERTDRSGFCALGSIKTNIGHLESAAGIAGLTKVLLQMRHDSLVPSLHAEQLNPSIDFSATPFRVQRELSPWRRLTLDGVERPRRACVSSFGAGGSNAHVIVEEHAPAPESGSVHEGPHLLVLSAKSEERLRMYAQRLLSFLKKRIAASEAGPGTRYSLGNIAHTLQVGRRALEERLAVLATSVAELVETLEAFVRSPGVPERAARGTASRARGHLAGLRERAAAVEQQAREGRLEELMTAWVQGAEVDWQRLPQRRGHRRVSLPTYPFQRDRAWIHDRQVLCEEPEVAPASRAALHPLVDENRSTLHEIRFSKRLSSREFFLRDHLVGDDLILPGVAIVEMARAAGELAAERPVRCVRNVVFTSPIKVADEPEEVYVRLQPGRDEAVDFEVYSLRSGQRRAHAQGKLVHAAADAPAPIERIDLDAVRGRCDARRIGAREAYALLDRIGLHLGPSFQSNLEIHAGEREAISRLELPAHLQGDFERYLLHPAMADGAQQVTAIAGLRGAQDIIHIPFSVGEFELLGRPPASCHAYVRLLDDDGAQRSPVRRYDVSLVDDTGRVFVKIKRFLSRPIQPSARNAEPVASEASPGPQALRRPAPPGAAPGGADAASQTLYFRGAWEPASLGPSGARSLRDGAIVLFGAGTSVRDALLARLREQGARARVLLVTPDRRFGRAGDDAFSLRLDAPEDYRALVSALMEDRPPPSAIAHLVCAGGGELATPEGRLARGFHSVLHLSRAILQHGLEDRLRMLFVHRAGPEGSAPELAAVSGFARSLRVESSKATLGTLELGGAAEPTADEVAHAVLSELSASDPEPAEARRAAGERRIFRLREVDPSLERDGHGASLRERGVYLVTGGLGGLGLILAEHLARTARARVALVGRSPLDAGREARLAELQALGAEIAYERADITRRAELDAAVASAKRRFGGLNGVIHTAGVLRDALLRNKTPEDVAAVLAPKTLGTTLLDEATRAEPLDFFALFSSTTALLGNLGQCDYAYANRFMDAFAELRERKRARGERSGKTISINWPLWRDGGMRVDAQVEQRLLGAWGMRPMSTASGLRAFDLALGSAGSHLLVISGDADRVRASLAPVGGARPEATRDELHASPPAAAPRAEASGGGGAGEDRGAEGALAPLLQRDLVRIFAGMLKIPEGRIDVDRNITDYGVESVGLMELSSLVNGRYGIDVTPASFFEYPTLGAFARHLLEDHGDAVLRRHGAALPDRAAAAGPEPERAPAAPAHVEVAPRASAAGEPPAVNGAASPVEPARGTTLVAGGASGATEPIAIIGMSGVMPLSEDLDAFWEHLAAGDDLISEIPADRWDWRAWYGDPAKEPNKTNIKWGGFIRDADKFDARFFGISRREAEFMDPQQRVFLEIVWRTIEDAGYRASELARRRVGVFAGVSLLDYAELLRDSGVDIEAYTTTGMFHSILANRVSFLMNFHGPSVPVDTACSSSLVAIRQASEAIWAGSCDVAIAGGINLLLHPMVYVSFSRASMLSLDGRCKTFDARANGYVRSEGGGALLLKPLGKALSDGDNIHAIIRGSAVNHGGRVNTMTAPNPNAQAELILSALGEAGLDPSTISYVEAHGTGTSLGDPIEVNGLKKAFKEGFRRSGKPIPNEPYCGIGSVKSNIGHLEPAAAISGIFKVILAMKHGMIPGNINFEAQNPFIQLDNTPFYLVTRSRPWERLCDDGGREIPRRAGVSSFGFGGVNGHLVLEEPIDARPRVDEAGPWLVPLSAKNEERLRAYAALLADHLDPAASGPPAAAPASAAASEEEVLARVTQELLEIVSQVGELGGADVSPDQAFTDLGFDAVRLTELAKRLSAAYGVSLDLSALVDHPSADSLARRLWQADAPRLIERDQGGERPRPAPLSGERPHLPDVAYTLQVGREAMDERLAVIASSAQELVDKLRAFGEGGAEIDDLHRGNAAKSAGQLDALLDGGEGEEFLRTLVRNRRLDKLARLWVSGVEVDWRLLHPSPTPRRIPLPTYPFARDRFWVPKSGSRYEALGRAAQPFLDGIDVGRSAGQGVFFRKTLRASDAIVGDHRVGGQLVFPGVGQIAMVAAAAWQSSQADGVEISRVVWLRPLVVDGETREARVRLTEEDGALRFEVQTLAGGEGGAVVVHSTGALRPLGAPGGAGGEGPPALVDAIRQRCPRAVGQAELYDAFARTGVALGGYFRTLQQAWLGDAEAVAEVRVPPEHAAEGARQVIPPGILDAALQLMGALTIVGAGRGAAPLLPFAVERIDLLRPFKEGGHVHVASTGELRFSAAIVDGQGRVCARLHDVTMREGRAQASPLYFLPGWRYAPLPGGERAGRAVGPDRRRVVIVHPGEDAWLASALAAAHGADEVILVRLGAEDRQRSAHAWEVRVADPSALAACVERLPAPDRLYFLGVEPREAPLEDLDAIEAAEERGVLSLFRLVKALRRRGWAAAPLALTVVTSDVADLRAGDVVRPLAAGLHGLTRSIAKEHPGWSVGCVDVSSDELGRPDVVAAIVAEPGGAGGAEIAVREARRYARVLRPVVMPPDGQVPLRPRGVYLIVGGAGGIGLEIALHLAAAVEARLVLVGRSALGPEQRGKIARIERAGGEVLYVQADAADAAGMRGAVQAARRRFGAIHGAIHSALVLRDRLLENMDEATFRAALAPKVRGSAALFQALGSEPLDFALFFSSVQSFSGNAGQSNYAAAGTFEDAFARHLGRARPYPVKIIHWGYWGTVGVVATEEHRRRMASQGVESLGPEDGVAAVRAVLRGRLGQVAVVRAADEALSALGVDLREEVVAYAEAPSLLERAAPAARAADLPSEVFERSLEAFDAVERLGERLLLAAFGRMGARLRAGERHDRDELARRLQIAPRHARLYGELLEILATAGLVRLDGAAVVGAPAPGERGAQDDAAALAAERQRVAARFPEKAGHVDLLWTCLERYPDVLQGRVSAMDVVFPGSSMEGVGRIYKGNTTSDYYNGLVASAVRAHLEAAAAALPPGRKTRILEIGAGTGGTTALVLDAISSHAGRFEYVFTDVSAGFVKHGQRQLGSSNPGMEFGVLDIERDVEGQGYAPGSVDIVIATNVLHATRRIADTLARAKALLRTNGWMILNEVTVAQRFTTLTFGLLDGWWLFEDGDVRLPGSPLLDAAGWRRLLAEEGFEKSVTLGQVGRDGRGLGQSVIIAESDGLVRRPRTSAGAAAAPNVRAGLDAASPAELRAPQAPSARPPVGPAQPAREEPAARENGAPRPAAAIDARERVEALVLEVLAEVLEVDRSELDASTPYTNLGVDSILSVAIAARLNRTLSIDLRSTDLFNYATARKLAAHIVASSGATLKLEPARHEPVEAPPEPPRHEASAASPPRAPHGARNGGRNGAAESAVLFFAEPPPPREEQARPARRAEPVEAAAPVSAREAPEHLGARGPEARPRTAAIVGISGRFPGARDVHELWRNLSRGVASVEEATRWDVAGFYDPSPRAQGKSYSKWGGFLSDVDRFDSLFFNISPKEAELMDPRQRLFLEEAWKAIEDAGYSERDLEEARCAVFVGCSSGDYRSLLDKGGNTPSPYSFMGTSSSILSARISYLLNLKGPSVPIDTACSSSLVALHLACEGICNGTYDMALVGGAEVLTTPDFHVMASGGTMLSPDGKCKTFDQKADGFVPGEAVAVLVLKELEAAVRDGDHVYGVIRGSGINQDGKTNGITAPSAPSQAALERDVYDRFGIDPSTITYVEAHGTGTKLGDPIEIQALTEAFRPYTGRRQFCAIGSVKTNVGHTLTAAGVVGVIKVLLCMQHEQLVPSLNLERENELIDFRDSPFYVNTELKPWSRGPSAPRRAAVSSFGFSGTNAHVVVEEHATPSSARASDRKPWYLIPLSARTQDALQRKLQDLAAWLERADPAPRLRDVAFTLQAGRSHFPVRTAIVARDAADLLRATNGLLQAGAAARPAQPAAGRSRAAEEQGRRLLAELAEPGLDAPQRRARLEQLAELYVQGQDLAWSALHEGEDHRRLSAPTYPFAGERHWFAPAEGGARPRAPARRARLHPLIDENTSTFEEQRFTTELSAGDPHVRDHVVEGRPVLPGVIALEVARAAGELSAGRRVEALRDVVWSSVVALAGAPRALQVSLYPSAEQAEFEVWTADEDGRRSKHAGGVVVFSGAGGAATPPAAIDPAGIQRRCGAPIEGAACYASLRARGLDYGPTFRVIEALHRGDGEVLARLRLPDAGDGSDGGYVLHPSLLDGALQAASWLLGPEPPADARVLPFLLEELRVFDPLSRARYAHVTPGRSGGGVSAFDVLVADGAGRPLAAVRGYAARAQPRPGAAAGPRAAPPEASADPALVQIFRQVQENAIPMADAIRLLDGHAKPA